MARNFPEGPPSAASRLGRLNVKCQPRVTVVRMTAITGRYEAAPTIAPLIQVAVGAAAAAVSGVAPIASLTAPAAKSPPMSMNVFRPAKRRQLLCGGA